MKPHDDHQSGFRAARPQHYSTKKKLYIVVLLVGIDLFIFKSWFSVQVIVLIAGVNSVFSIIMRELYESYSWLVFFFY